LRFAHSIWVLTVVKASDVSILYAAEDVVTGSTDYNYDYVSDITAYINVINVATYEPKTVSPVVLSSSDQIVVVQLDLECGKYGNP